MTRGDEESDIVEDVSLGPELERVESFDSGEINLDSASNDPRDFTPCRRTEYVSQSQVKPPISNTSCDEPFGTPQLGARGASSLMFELSKGVLRLKDDLFVAVFTKPDGYFEKAEQLIAIASGQEVPAETSTATQPLNRGKGRPPTLKKFESKFPVGAVSQECLTLLRNLPTNTSDPDDILKCPLLDNRHTFLEVCQYRSFQFDSLRRAKNSSLAMLCYLQNPDAENLRIDCVLCKNKIKYVRWHCEQSPYYDICGDCHAAPLEASPKHGIVSPYDPSHELTPIPVTFL